MYHYSECCAAGHHHLDYNPDTNHNSDAISATTADKHSAADLDTTAEQHTAAVIDADKNHYTIDYTNTVENTDPVLHKLADQYSTAANSDPDADTQLDTVAKRNENTAADVDPNTGLHEYTKPGSNLDPSLPV